MRAEIVSIGTELLLGEIADANAPYLAGQLPLLGIDLFWISTVGDNQERLTQVFRRAWERSDLILTSGGLGPTEADITRQAIATVVSEETKIDNGLEKEIRALFSRRGVEMPASNLRQATVIPSAKPLHNIQGTAPGWWVEKEGRILIAMPGPPYEMRQMWEGEVFPMLRGRARGEVIFSRTLKTLGLSEAAMGEKLRSFLLSANPTLGIYVRDDGIHLRVTAKEGTRMAAERLATQRVEELRQSLGPYVWGADTDTLPEMVGHLLTARGLRLATMESCTGGLLSSTITDTPGSSAYFIGGIVAYSGDAKSISGVNRQLIERFGTVSQETASAMAEAVRSLFKTDIGVGVTGVAGPSAIENHPVGTIYIAVNGSRHRGFHHCIPGNRQQVKQRATTAALNELRKSLTQ